MRRPLVASFVLAGLALRLLAPLPVAAQTSELVIVRDGSGAADKIYHRPGCPVIRDGRGVLAMTRAEAESRGYKAHRDCDPAVTGKTGPPSQPPGPSGTAPATTPPETVVVDAAGKYYHRKTCAKIGKDPKPIALTAVGKRWPCPVCRPPVRKRASDPLVPGWRG